VCSPGVAQTQRRATTQMADEKRITDRYLRARHRRDQVSASRCSTPPSPVSVSAAVAPRIPTLHGAARLERSHLLLNAKVLTGYSPARGRQGHLGGDQGGESRTHRGGVG